MFPSCPIRTKCIADARKEAEERNTGRERTKEEVEEDVCKSVLDVSRRLTQARLGVSLLRGYKYKAEGEDLYETKPVVSKDDKLQMDKKANVITLTGVAKAGEQGGKTIVGTLNVHLNGFFYATSSPNFHIQFLYMNVKKAFFRVEDEKRPALLHFHLYHPIKVGAEKTQDIQFHLVQTPVGQRDYYNGSDKIVEDLKNFVDKVEAKWIHLPVFRCCFPFAGAELHKTDEFQGNLPSKAPTVFAINCFSLVGIVDEPFVVVHLRDVEIVNLGKRALGAVVVDMTVIFKDVKREPVYINSIPLASLDLIKDRLNFAHVKYFENYGSLDWDSIVKKRADSPKEFYEDRGRSVYNLSRGWTAFNLEELKTVYLYKYYLAEPEVNYLDNPKVIYESDDGWETEDDCESDLDNSDDGVESEDDCESEDEG